MNPIFVLLVLLVAFLVWLTFSFLYRPIGAFFKRLWDDSQEAMGNIKESAEDDKDKEEVNK